MNPEIEAQKYLETYKSLVEYSVEAVKYLLLINGGGSVALLAYMGEQAKTSAVSPGLKWALLLFIAGLVTAGSVIGVAYKSQFELLNELRSDDDSYLHMTWVRLGAVLFAVSILCFAAGAWKAAVSF